MAASTRNLFLCYILAILLHISVSIYEDQIGKFDWRQQYIGKIEHIEIDQSSTSVGRKVFAATNKNVIAALNGKTGHIIWRQILEEDVAGTIDSLLYSKGVLITVSGHGMYVRRWDSIHGNLIWEKAISATPATNRASTIICGNNKGSIAVSSNGQLSIYSIANGEEQYSLEMPNSASTVYKYLYESGANLIVVGVSAKSHVSVVTVTEGRLTSQKPVVTPWMTLNTRCIMTHGGHLVCLDDNNIMMYSLSLTSGQHFQTSSLQALGLGGHEEHSLELSPAGGSSDNLLLYRAPGHAGLLKVSPGGIESVMDVKDATVVNLVTLEDKILLAALRKFNNEESQMIFYDIQSKEELTSFTSTVHTPPHHGTPQLLNIIILKKKDSSVTYRNLVLFEDHALLMIHQSGKLIWSREEGLASLVAVEMVDLPVSENEAKMEDEFGRKNDIVTMFVNRLKTQLSQIHTFLLDIKSQLLKRSPHQRNVLDEPESLSEEEEKEYTRDSFNLRKMIVGVSETGKIYGMDSMTGQLVWRHLVPGVHTFDKNGKNSLLLYVQRTTAHFPHEPQCVLIGQQNTGNGLVYSFNPITGKPVNDGGANNGVVLLGYAIQQAFIIPHTNSDFLKGVIVMGDNKKVHTFPASTEEIIKENKLNIFLYTADKGTGSITGYQAQRSMSDELSAVETWTVNIPQDTQTITHIVSRRGSEHVHSQGKILADRSVLYKYINPNLVVVATQGLDSTQKSFISLYLLDTVTGRIVFQVTHKRSMGPVHIVHSENWVVYNYCYLTLKSCRNEMAVLELFEGSKQHNATVFSSLDPPPPPIVMRQSYILPVHISSMAVTLTEMGLTAKHLLIAMKNGPLAEMPKFFLDPRRPVMLTPEHREEGIVPYMPELPISYEYIVNYNQSIFRIHGIQTAPAGLESTCLVLAYGLDLFYSRVMPSKMFDVLKEDFDYYFIACVLGAMILVSVISQKLATRKALNRAWN